MEIPGQISAEIDMLGFSLLSVVAFLEAATQQDHPVRAKGSKL